MSPAYPSLYQVNTRVLLTALSRTLGRPATLDDIPDAELDRIAGLGFDYVWLLSVWRTGSAGQRVSSAHAGWRHEFEDTLPDRHGANIHVYMAQRHSAHSGATVRRTGRG